MSHVLTYDTLPAHSRLRRDVVDGVLRITAAAEEPGPMVRRAAMVKSALPAGGMAAAALGVFVAIFGMVYLANRRGMSPELTIALAAAFLVFSTALFVLIWRAQYASRLDAAQHALQQTTLLAACTGRLIIETAGPLGQASYDLACSGDRPEIAGISRATCDARGKVDCLQVLLSDGTRIHILPGRDEHELRWVARALTRAIGV